MATLTRHAAPAGAVCAATPGRAGATTLNLKLGDDLRAAHSVNVRLRQAVAVIAEETHGDVAIR